MMVSDVLSLAPNFEMGGKVRTENMPSELRMERCRDCRSNGQVGHQVGSEITGIQAWRSQVGPPRLWGHEPDPPQKNEEVATKDTKDTKRGIWNLSEGWFTRSARRGADPTRTSPPSASPVPFQLLIGVHRCSSVAELALFFPLRSFCCSLCSLCPLWPIFFSPAVLCGGP